MSKPIDKCHDIFQILKGNTNFEWTEECEKAFKNLKEYLGSPFLLVKPKLGDVLQLYLAVSGYIYIYISNKLNASEVRR